MLRKKYIGLLFFVSLCGACKSQQKDMQFEGSGFIEVRSQLIKFLKEQEKLHVDSTLFIVGLSNDFTYPFELHKGVFVPGIYKFGSGFSHSGTYLVIVYNDHAKILKDYSTMHVLEEVEDQIKNLGILDNKKQLKVIQNIITVLSQRSSLQ